MKQKKDFEDMSPEEFGEEMRNRQSRATHRGEKFDTSGMQEFLDRNPFPDTLGWHLETKDDAGQRKEPDNSSSIANCDDPESRPEQEEKFYPDFTISRCAIAGAVAIVVSVVTVNLRVEGIEFGFGDVIKFFIVCSLLGLPWLAFAIADSKRPITLSAGLGVLAMGTVLSAGCAVPYAILLGLFIIFTK